MNQCFDQALALPRREVEVMGRSTRSTKQHRREPPPWKEEKRRKEFSLEHFVEPLRRRRARKKMWSRWLSRNQPRLNALGAAASGSRYGGGHRICSAVSQPPQQPKPPRLEVFRLLSRALCVESARNGGGASSPPPPSLAGDKDPISFTEAKSLMRLVNVEALKKKLGMEEKEVIAYEELLEACQSIGVAKSRDEAVAFAQVLDQAGVILLFQDKVYRHPDKVDHPMASSSMSPRWNYDVFLSFRGEDTYEGFTNFLYDALCRHGINTFLDDQLPKGQGISAELSEKIEKSRISIVVFSENYASSGWCLDELVKILECKETKGHMVRPIFYRVDPSELRKQTGKTGDYLAKHEDKFGKDSERVMKWRKSVEDLANMAGWHFSNGVESKLIQAIVREVSSKLNCPALNVATHPVGIDDTLDGINPILGIGLDDVRMIGFYGIGGIGKSTVAKAIYNLHADNFEGSSFLANVKEVSRQHGLVQVQEMLLFEILGDSNIKLGNADRGINLISRRLCYKKVLIVIDDIDHLDQLRKLAGDKSWFGSGSRIIITTRDQHLLEAHGVEHFHEVKKLNFIDSYKLFCWNAFKSPNPPEEFKDLTCSLLDYAKGLPLALIVLGSFLCGRNVREWESAIARLKSVPDLEYNEILKISYDGLDDLDSQKEANSQVLKFPWSKFAFCPC